MKKTETIIQAGVTACVIICVVVIGLRLLYADRFSPHTYIGSFPLGGSQKSQLAGTLLAYQQQLQHMHVTISFRGRKAVHTFEELGTTVDIPGTQQDILRATSNIWKLAPVRVPPVLVFQDDIAHAILMKDFAEVVSLPKNAGITIDASYNVSISNSAAGEDFDMQQIDNGITQELGYSSMQPVVATARRADPTVNAAQITHTQAYAQGLMQSGFTLTYQDNSFVIGKADIAHMVQFEASPGPHLLFASDMLRNYLEQNVSPKIHVEPVNARFQMQDGAVTQFALPKSGVDLDVDATMKGVANALMQEQNSAAMITSEVQPTFTDAQSSSSLGITKLIATGETDFRGSPKHRIVNITVGADKFNGILIAPGEEFSFDKLLGPVDASTGYLPELVIKDNATLPEFGGGLCQVSTTAFRAAMYAGVKITERHNHSYAVRYYGIPGFDATIYPPYTDFRFLNNTPGYLLIQTHIDGTKLFFEFWGTDDGRHVTIDGPHPYDRKPDGSVKSVLKRTVTDANGNVIENDTFNSNYKSPNLFPHEPAKQASNTAGAASSESAPNGNA
ncbi:MAG TPA: VanW family protein [Candidatus Andersenbacteria bacterium]|nr:VanW family protein [Candidatus Andersenbacteria bacterium]